jgi:hypothetical protein
MVIKSTKKKAIIKKSVVKKKPSTKKKAQEIKTNLFPKSYVIIDYPVESEKINSFHYAVRIGASSDGYVEVSFNNGEWMPCRFNSGYWWFDWADLNPGDYNLIARLVTPQGSTILETAPRKCKIC